MGRHQRIWTAELELSVNSHHRSLTSRACLLDLLELSLEAGQCLERCCPSACKPTSAAIDPENWANPNAHPPGTNCWNAASFLPVCLTFPASLTLHSCYKYALVRRSWWFEIQETHPLDLCSCIYSFQITCCQFTISFMPALLPSVAPVAQISGYAPSTDKAERALSGSSTQCSSRQPTVDSTPAVKRGWGQRSFSSKF